MDRGSEDDAPPDEDCGCHAASTEDGEVEVTPACSLSGGVAEILAHGIWGLLNQEQERMAGPTMFGEQGDVVNPPSVSPISLMDTCAPSISTLPSCSYSSSRHTDFSSSSSSPLSLSPPLPPSVELSAVLTDTRLTLDVYRGGAAALPLLWESIPGQLKGLQYLRLGSEEKAGLDGALDVLSHLTKLRSLAIRGTFFINLFQCHLLVTILVSLHFSCCL